jgi:radical SAM protein with 4Fe4S-binding SPASM domain
MWQKARIMPDGTFSPCMHVVFGNIQDRSLMKMWNGSAMARFRDILSKRLFPACVRCCNRGFRALKDGRDLRG